MKIFFSLLMLLSILYGGDATIEVIKKVESLPSLAVEDSSKDYTDTFQLKFFKTLVADLNVISIFNVDRHHRKTDFNTENVVLENKDMDYVLRYSISKGDSNSLFVKIKLLLNNKEVLFKRYKVSKKEIYMFVSHAIAYDINEYMGQPSVEWMKRKVIFSRIIAPSKSEIVISDYTLSYQHIAIKGGFNIFPKWANSKQTSFYYTSLDSTIPELKFVDIKKGKSKTVMSSDGMMICSDISNDGTKLLLTKAPYGQPDIYMYDLTKHTSKRITKYSGIDVNAQFMDNDNIVFISNRMGYPNVFTKNINGSHVKQMVHYGKSNAACSSSGEYVVYKSRESSNAFLKNTFNLHLISTKTNFIRRLTAVGINEFPRFSKDGDAILFIKSYKGESSLGIIRLNYNKNYLFPLKYGKIQSMDW
ncbi:MAG: Tol-Pal system protein TolB [Campylobacterota bacterium]|nr:Tol-Pal system protein TolB [Campylobacterota bacterium]